MTRFVELPIVSERGSVVWVNPDHVVAVEASHQDGKCWLMTEMGSRTHVDLSQGAVVECLSHLPTMVEALAADKARFMGLNGWNAADGEAIELRDSVRENLTR